MADFIERDNINKQELLSLEEVPPEKRKHLENAINIGYKAFSNHPEGARLKAKEFLGIITEDERRELDDIRNKFDLFPQETPEFLEKNPIIEKQTIAIGEHTIEIINQNQAVKLDESYIEELKEALEKINNLSPDLIKNYLKIFIINDPEAEQRIYGANGTNVSRRSENQSRGIVINQLGFSIDKLHRIPGVNNLRGTITHELGHAISKLFPDSYNDFGKRLKYKPIWKGGQIVDPNWEFVRFVESGAPEFKHKETGLVTRSTLVSENLDKLPSSYAAFSQDEDISESFVAYVFNPQVLDDERKRFFDDLFRRRGQAGKA